MIDAVPEPEPSEPAATPAPPSVDLLGRVDPEPSPQPEPPRRPGLIRLLTLVGAVLIVVSVVLTVVMVSVQISGRHSAAKPSASGSTLVPGAVGLHGSAALAGFFTKAVTPPVAIEQTWGQAGASAFYSSTDANKPIVSVRFQSLGEVAGTSFWGVLALDNANGGVVCLVTQDMKQQSTCETIAEFVTNGDAFDSSTDWSWKRVTWKPDGSFGMLPLPGVGTAEADTPAFQVINNSAPELFRSAGVLNAAGTRLQNALNNPSPVFGQLRSASGKVFGVASDTTLTTVCVSALDSVAPSCDSGAAIAESGLLVATAQGKYRWSPDGTIAPATR